MVNNIISKIVRINSFNVVSVSLEEKTDVFRVLGIKKKAGSLIVENTTEYVGWDDVLKGIGNKLPVVLVMDGNGILNKKINFNEPADVAWYKNIDFNLIFFTSLKTPGSDFISFCRKSIVDDCLAKFVEAGITVMDIYVGSFIAALVKPSIPADTIFAANLQLTFEGSALIAFKKTVEKKDVAYKIGNDSVSSDLLPAYGAMLHFFLQNQEIEKTKSSISQSEELLYKKTFNVFGAGMLISFFVSLLVSYILTGYFISENAQLNLEKIYSGDTYNKIAGLEAQKQDKLKILKESGFMTNTFYSFYGYELMEMTPTEVSLSQINITPVTNEVRTEKKISFDSGIITVKGFCYEESSLNNWLLKVREAKWVENLEIISVKKDKKGKSVFDVKITLRKNV